MEHDQSDLEEGELSSNSDTTYNPLPRPENFSSALSSNAPRFPPVIKDSDSEPEQESSEDSDSDPGKPKVKRPKIKLKPLPKLLKRPKKYDIWSTRVQEDVLSETLNSCDVTAKDRSRDIESYDYPSANKYYEEKSSNKRTNEDRHYNRKRGKQRNKSEEKKGSCRNIFNLTVTLDSELEDVAKDIANKLYEEKEDLILKIVQTIGKEKCFQLFGKTQEIEADGGMLILNQSRRRTPGGVFLYLTRMDEDLTKEQRNQIFGDEDKKLKEERKLKKKKKYLKLKLEIAQAQANHQKQDKKPQKTNVPLANPPPSPATEDCVNSREDLVAYDDDFLDITAAPLDMELL